MMDDSQDQVGSSHPASCFLVPEVYIHAIAKVKKGGKKNDKKKSTLVCWAEASADSGWVISGVSGI